MQPKQNKIITPIQIIIQVDDLIVKHLDTVNEGGVIEDMLCK